MTPMAYASKFGHTEAVKALLEFKAKLNVGAGPERMTPLCYAATYGMPDLV
jgi:ankyrin repeat protein